MKCLYFESYREFLFETHYQIQANNILFKIIIFITQVLEILKNISLNKVNALSKAAILLVPKGKSSYREDIFGLR